MEREQIQNIFERLNGIGELKYTLNSEKLDISTRELITSKIDKELPILKEEYKKWWAAMCKKYQWKAVENGNFVIKFDKNEVFIAF